MRMITWNMQGSNHSTENKWNSGVLNMMTQTRADTCCLQECGAVPDSARLLAPNYGGIPGVSIYDWGSERSLKYILFYPWDTNGNRCNLALVSVLLPVNPQLLYPATPPTWRPLLGAQIGSGYVFTAHAISPGGPDTHGLLTAAGTAVGTNWITAGDFNRDPDGTFPAGAWTVWPANTYTYPATRPVNDYDFAVRGGVAGPATVMVLDLYMSDHLPVLYDV